MNLKSIQSHYYLAQELLSQGQLGSASREAELAVDGFWKEGDARITQALPLLSMLRHCRQAEGDLFESLVDLPTSFSDSLMFESMSLHEQYQNDASAKMMADVNRFMKRWANDSIFEEVPLQDEAVEKKPVDEKVSCLREQIAQFYADGKRDLAVEASLQLANEYALRGKNKRAFKLFTQVAAKSKRPERTPVRIDCLLDFGQFMSRNSKLTDAERLLRIAAAVARNARDKDRFARVLVALGVVLAHQSKDDSAKKYLEKAKSMLNVWDVEIDIVEQHLAALADGVSCECPTAVADLSFAGVDWD